MNTMRKSLLITCLVSLFAVPALADLKPGQYAGVRPCKGSSNGVDIEVTSKKTIGVATCKSELQKQFIAKGLCSGRKKHEKVEYSFTFGDDKDPNQTKGNHWFSCK
jgi:hypothetical protein